MSARDRLVRGVDPVRLEVYRHLLASVAEEMGAVLRRSAFSPNIKERRDYSCALFGPDAEMAALAAHIPVHLGAMPLSVASCVEELELGLGDVAILNDPYRGGSHLPDITLVAPAFAGKAGGRLLGFVANRAHHADVGGRTPGSMGLAAELWEEGVVIAPQLLVRGGEVQTELLDFILGSVRTPQEREGDLRAQLASIRRGQHRLAEMCDRYGPGESLRYMGELADYSERVARRFVASMSNGRYRFEDALDDDGVSEEPVPIVATVTISGDEAEVDFTGSSPQRPSSVNAPYAVAVSATYYVFRALIGGEVPSNGGILRPIRVTAPEGTVVNPRPPAAVAAGNVETSQRITDVLLGALAQALPDRVPAASQGTMNNVTVGGRDPARGRPYAYYETIAGGAGASPGADGASATHTHMTNTLNTPAEALEYAYPLRVLRYEVRRESGGEGEHRGGDGVRRDLQVLAPAKACLMSDRRRLAPYGLDGGAAGDTGRNLLIRGEREEELPGKACFDLEAGDVLSVRTPGGGGHGAVGQARAYRLAERE
ncbi:MAG: hydantoinase B/oxoprolinase family protein [Gemmatimonadales bacterium]